MEGGCRIKRKVHPRLKNRKKSGYGRIFFIKNRPVFAKTDPSCKI